MSEAETGQYIRILCHMHQSGHLSIEDMKIICPNISFKVLAKFRTDDKGLYYNERLESEVERRRNYSESRRNNRLKNKKETHDITYVPAVSGHMETENENEIKTAIGTKGVQGETDFSDYENWTRGILSGDDWLFNDKLRNMNIPIGERLEEFANSHLALLAKYPKMKPTDQNRFRISLIGHINDKLRERQVNKSVVKKVKFEDV